MEKRILLKSQINAIYKYIDNAGLNHNDFKWISERSSFNPSLEVPKLLHQPSNYYFKFDIKENDLPATQYFPNQHGVIYTQTWVSWEPQFNDFIMWIDILKNELGTPNLWEQILDQKKFFEDVSDVDLSNKSFNIKEQKYISSKILEIETFLKEKHGLFGNDIEIIKNRLNYLEETSKRLGRKDWLNILIGVSFKIAFDIGLSAIPAKEFFNFIGTAFSNFLGGPSLLP